jgi:hypothetical protein
MEMIAVKAMVGSNYVRSDQVIAITTTDPAKCTIYLAGGVMVPCSEPAASVLARLGATTPEKAEVG